jgi:hypothetical protein
MIPRIWNGMDIQAIGGIFMEQFQRRMADRGFAPGAFYFSKDEANLMMADVPSTPDERLR